MGVRGSTLFGAWVLGLGLLVLCAHAHARWNPLTSGISEEDVSRYHDWFVSQMRAPEAPFPGPCCGDEEHYGGDGHYVDVRTLPNGHYEVFVKEAGAWMLYPFPVNPSYPNPTGENVAWYVAYRINDSWSVTWFCLRLAQGT